jgi:hypothetical protein
MGRTSRNDFLLSAGETFGLRSGQPRARRSRRGPTHSEQPILQLRTDEYECEWQEGSRCLLITALAGGASYGEGPRIARLSKATVARRMAEPVFRSRVIEEREQSIDRVRGVLAEGSVAAAESLVGLISEAKSESVRFAACCRVVEFALRRRPGFDTFSGDEVAELIRTLVELALARMPEDDHLPYLQEVRALGAR